MVNWVLTLRKANPLVDQDGSGAKSAISVNTYTFTFNLAFAL